MNLPLFLARRMYKGEETDKTASRPAVLVAMIGIAVGLAVMIISVSIIIGFKKEVREKIVGFGGDVQVSNLYAGQAYETRPVVADNRMLATMQSASQVQKAQRYSTKPGMLKTADSFQGILLKGVGQEYDFSFFEKHLLEGEIPQYSDSLPSNKVLISRTLADKMKLGLGDKIDTYYIQNEVRARRFTIVGIYQTNFTEYDNLFLITDMFTVNRLNQWEPNQVTGVELLLHPDVSLEEYTYSLADSLSRITDEYGQRYCVRNVEQLNPQITAWLDILDVNIWVILVLMIGVSGFTMISGLQIIIIERTSMIGILKSLGCNDMTIRKTFLWFAVFLIGKGMLWGNVLGLAFYFIQHYWGIFSLDPEIYYMDTVPVGMNFWLMLLLNVGTLLASVLMLIAPSYLISRIHPADSMRYE